MLLLWSLSTRTTEFRWVLEQFVVNSIRTIRFFFVRSRRYFEQVAVYCDEMLILYREHFIMAIQCQVSPHLLSISYTTLSSLYFFFYVAPKTFIVRILDLDGELEFNSALSGETGYRWYRWYRYFTFRWQWRISRTQIDCTLLSYNNTSFIRLLAKILQSYFELRAVFVCYTSLNLC